jgi:hypothetical protein
VSFENVFEQDVLARIGGHGGFPSGKRKVDFARR